MKEYVESFSEESPGFSGFRDLMDRWDQIMAINESKDAIEKILDKHEVILFFVVGKELFGAPEPSRLIFAKLNTEDEDDPMEPGFRDEARFSAVNLLRCMEGEDENGIERVFGLKDLPKIKVIDKEGAVKIMMAAAKK